MHNFKAGDLVERLGGCFNGMGKGDTARVSLVKKQGLVLHGYSGVHEAKKFKLHHVHEDERVIVTKDE